MKHLRIGVRALLVLMMVATGIMGSIGGRALAQGATTFVSPMTGIPITTSGPWSVDPTMVVSESGAESITVMSEFEFMQVWFLPGNTDLVQARDVVLDSLAQEFGTFVEIDRGAYGNVSYSLDVTSAEGIEFGVFSLFLGQRSSGYVEYYVYFGAMSLFAQGFASAQQNVTVNGTPVFEGVDGAGLQNLLLANAGVTGASPSTTTTQAPPVPAEDPQQPTPPPATQEQPASNDGAAYLQTLQGEITYLNQTVSDYLTAFGLMETDPEAAVAGMDQVVGEWTAYPQRAAGITAPPGYETIDASYRAIVAETEALSGLWQAAIQSAQAQDGTTGDKIAEMFIRVLSLQVMIEDLNTEVTAANSGGSTTTTTAQPTQPPADTPAEPTGGLTPEQSAYIQTVRSEISMLATSMDDFQTTFIAYLEGTSPNPDLAIQEINNTVAMWRAYTQTAAAIPAPAGMEEIGTAYQNLALGMATAGDTFIAAVQMGADGDAAGSQAIMEDFINQLTGLYGQIDSLNTLLDQYEQQGAGSTTTTTTEAPQPPAETPVPTQDPGTTTTAPAGDGDAYLASIAGETEAIMDSIVLFAEGIELLGSTDTAEQDQGIANINEAVSYWATYDQVAAGIVAPAGYEDVDAAYRQLASDVTELATRFDAWIGADDATRQARAEEFGVLFAGVQDQIEALNGMLGGVSTGGTSTGSEPQNVPEDITETGNRGELPQIPPRNTDAPSSGGSSTGDASDLGLVSDTEYVSPQYDIEVVWDDRWEFGGDVIDDAIGSDADRDWVTLVWTDGDIGYITISLGDEGDYDLDEIVEEWESDSFLDGLGVTGEVVLSEAGNDRGGVLILVDDGGEGSVLYYEAVCLSRSCDEIAFIELSAPVIDATDMIADAEEGVEIEGEGATGVFSSRQINRALDQ